VRTDGAGLAAWMVVNDTWGGHWWQLDARSESVERKRPGVLILWSAGVLLPL